MIGRNALGLCGLLLCAGPAAAALPPAMAPLADYLMPRDAEISLARSAAPPSISANATVLVLGPHGYETAASGTNGFTCLVERGWEAGFGDPDFWNARLRGPLCFNAEAARTVWPAHKERTDWVLAGLGMAQMRERASASALAHAAPAPGAMCFMMSKDGYLSSTGGHWHPHLMFYLSGAGAASWGANQPGSPVIGGAGDPEPVVTYMVLVPKWSDGSPAMEMAEP
ncbi:MAG: hypothetical protein WDN01_09265 [Rhizomicrobium sp.]